MFRFWANCPCVVIISIMERSWCAENKNDMMEDLPRFADQSALYAPERSKGHTFLYAAREGKSFRDWKSRCQSLAYLGKKVVVVGMDIRKAGLE